MRRSLLAAASVLLLSCSDPTSFSEDLVVTASVAPSVFRAGEVTTVTVEVMNRGSRTHLLRNECVSPFVVESEDGSKGVGPAPIVCIAIPFPPTELRTGEELTITRQWNGDGGVKTDSGLLPAGTYLLRGRVYPAPAGRVTGPPVKITIEE